VYPVSGILVQTAFIRASHQAPNMREKEHINAADHCFGHVNASGKQGMATAVSASPFSTSSDNELLLAFISADQISSSRVTVTGIYRWRTGLGSC
jgi:hypothetical protein